MNAYAFLAVFSGAGFGACLRWWLGIVLNPVFPTLPLGTLAANLLGGYLIGVAVAYFSINTSLPPEARLLVITGFMGALTTFSSFSAEVVEMALAARYVQAFGTVVLHLFGSLTMTLVGIKLAAVLFAR